MSYDREGPLMPGKEKLLCERMRRRIDLRIKMDILKLDIQKHLDAALRVSNELKAAEKEFEQLG